jgi:hypothetical protein
LKELLKELSVASPARTQAGLGNRSALDSEVRSEAIIVAAVQSPESVVRLQVPCCAVPRAVNRQARCRGCRKKEQGKEQGGEERAGGAGRERREQ